MACDVIWVVEKLEEWNDRMKMNQIEKAKLELKKERERIQTIAYWYIS